jgi:hypothetical protein
VVAGIEWERNGRKRGGEERRNRDRKGKGRGRNEG